MFVIPVSPALLVYLPLLAGLVITLGAGKILDAVGFAAVFGLVVFLHIVIRRGRKEREREEAIVMMREAIDRAQRGEAR